MLQFCVYSFNDYLKHDLFAVSLISGSCVITELLLLNMQRLHVDLTSQMCLNEAMWTLNEEVVTFTERWSWQRCITHRDRHVSLLTSASCIGSELLLLWPPHACDDVWAVRAETWWRSWSSTRALFSSETHSKGSASAGGYTHTHTHTMCCSVSLGLILCV